MIIQKVAIWWQDRFSRRIFQEHHNTELTGSGCMTLSSEWGLMAWVLMKEQGRVNYTLALNI